MAVRSAPAAPEGLLPVPGIALGTALGSIKNWDRDDVVMIAADAGHAGIVALLIARGASRSAKDRDGKTALDLAADQEVRAKLAAQN